MWKWRRFIFSTFPDKRWNPQSVLSPSLNILSPCDALLEKHFTIYIFHMYVTLHYKMTIQYFVGWHHDLMAHAQYLFLTGCAHCHIITQIMCDQLWLYLRWLALPCTGTPTPPPPHNFTGNPQIYKWQVHYILVIMSFYNSN